MSVCTIHLPPDGNRENFRLVAEGKSLFALLAPPVFLVWHRLWLALLGYMVGVAAIAAFAGMMENPWSALLGVLPGLYFFIEGNQFVRRGLDRRGWREVGVVEAGSKASAEERAARMLFSIPEIKAHAVPSEPKPPVVVRRSPGHQGIFPE